jgi:hypothetical protein
MSVLSQFLGGPTSGAFSLEITSNTFIVQGATSDLGAYSSGGHIICRSGGVAIIVSPRNSEVSRSWPQINNAITTAQQVSGCTGWFVPTCAQLQNPGACCRMFWDLCSCNQDYWSSTLPPSNCAIAVRWTDNSVYTNIANLPSVKCVRAFRCVTY